ncbi:MAG: hypothetical protein ACP5FH_04515 [Terracidiphilus sp.]
MGYHPGVEDDGIYLSAVKSDLNPALYPHDARFVRSQVQATIFDKGIAAFVRWTGISVADTELLFQFASILLIVFSCWSIARLLFQQAWVQWAGVALVTAMFTLPVAGTALYLVDQHLHPRNMATALILLAVARILAGRHGQAVPLLLLAFLLHPIMGAMGLSFCVFLFLVLLEPGHAWLRRWRKSARPSLLAGFLPLGWILEPPTPAWRAAAMTRTYLFLFQWTWYEWLGAVAPLVLFYLLWRMARKQGETLLARFALAVLLYGVFQMAVAIVMLAPPALIRLAPLQPMRFLQIVYFFMILMGGCLLGKYLLKTHIWRWALYLVVINASMFASQQMLFASSEHLELPGRKPENAWLQAFAWIRHNTPTDAYFALDPRYLAAPGEDYHSFRALAERSQLADAIKDTAVVTLVPDLGGVWERQENAQKGWSHFKLADFERLKAEFGVGWVVVSYPPPTGLLCEWHNRVVSVCRIP